MVDVNCAWNVDESITMARRFEAYDLEWLEEPVWLPDDFAGLARGGALQPVAGEIQVPTGPGLGLELDPEVLSRYAWR